MRVADAEIPMIQASGWNAESFRVGWLAGKAAAGSRKRCPFVGDTPSNAILRAAYAAGRAFNEELKRC